VWRPSEGAFAAEALVRDVSIASPLWGAPRICGELKLGIDVGQTTVATISFRLLYGFLILHHGRREILWIGTTSPRVPIGSLVNSQKPSAGRKGHDTTFATEIALRAISSGDFRRWAFEIFQPRRGRYRRTDIVNGLST
jgi:hypothetical protein